MPVPPNAPPDTSANQLPSPSYPALETFAEKAIPDDVRQVFSAVEEALSGLRGPLVSKREKVALAIAHTKELLSLLVETRLRMEQESKGKSGGR